MKFQKALPRAAKEEFGLCNISPWGSSIVSAFRLLSIAAFPQFSYPPAGFKTDIAFNIGFGTVRSPMKTLLSLLAIIAMPLAAIGKDSKEKAPSGYISIDELAKAQEKAKTGKKLIAVLAKGANDNCPHCVTAKSVGESALKSDCVLVFTRSENIGSKTLPEPVKNGLAGSPTGAAVTFVVFNQDMTEVVGKIGRDALETDKKAVSALKKTVDEARKKITATPAK
jgi:hypothetical protein